MSQEKQRARPQVSEPSGDFLRCGRVLSFKGQDDLCFVRLTCRASRPFREYITSNGEVLIARMYLREIGNGVDRLETEAEAAN
ncbi:hypothetical protein D3C75_1223550 [compost metagenome]